ncbi:hypothetical protein L1887_09186 [Cichorium endivia]|nr:hypothetical protein L1887_09186 [Cichorium endivia]
MTINLPVTMQILVVFLLLHTACAAILYRCPNCGMTPVPYPLSTDVYTCGQPKYKIRCDSGVLKFDTLDNTYRIISISPNNQRLVIQQPSVLPNTCVMDGHASHGIRLNASSPFTITSSNTAFFFNCTNTILPAALDCSPTSPCWAYQNGSARMSVCQRSPRCCFLKNSSQTEQGCFSIAMEHCGAYTNFVNLDFSLPISKWPDPAVELMWALPSERPCKTQACCDSTFNSICRDTGDGALRCYCKPNYRWDAIGGRCASDLIRIRRKRTILVATTTCSGVIIFLMVVFATIMLTRHKRIKAEQQRLAHERKEMVSSGDGGKSAKIFTSKEIKRATNNYSSKGLLGVGGFGEVYKGVLDDGTEVAVKCAKLGNTKSIDQKAIDFSRATDDVNLAAYVKRMVNKELLVDVIDPVLKKPATSLEIDSMKALGFLAMSCLEERRENRPSMKEVYEEIEYIMSISRVS